jgi:DNA-binding IclR family transcriptional regulator
VDGDEVPVRSVARALDLMIALEDGPQALGALARTSQLSKGTAYRILTTLATSGLVIQDPATSTYALGPACFGILDAIVHGSGGLDVIAGPVLGQLSATTRETVALYVRAGPQRICVAQVASPQPIRYTARLGMENPVYAGAMGKVLLAFSDARERAEILDRMPLLAWTSATITDRRRLEKELDGIRRAGFGQSRGERSAGVAAIAAPVFGLDRRIMAALSIVGPEERMTDVAMRGFREPLLAAAVAVTDRISAFSGEPPTWSADGDDPVAGTRADA